MSKPTINRALRHVLKEGNTCLFRFLGDPMVLVSEEKGALTPIAALGFKAQEQQGQCTTVYQREEGKFHGLISVANQAFQFDLTNLCGSLDHDNENRQLNFNILQDGKLINEVNVVRPWETVEVKSDQQHQNKRLILEEDTKMVDDKPQTFTIQENESSAEPKKGAVYEVVVTPQQGPLLDLFKNKKLYWVSADKVQHLFKLTESSSSKHQVALLQDGLFEIKPKQVYRGFEFSFGGSSNNNNNSTSTCALAEPYYHSRSGQTQAFGGSSNSGQTFGFNSNSFGAPSFSNGLPQNTTFAFASSVNNASSHSLSANQPQYNTFESSRSRGVPKGRDRSRSRERISNSAFGATVVEQGAILDRIEPELTRSLEWGQELEESNSRSLPNEPEDLDIPLSANGSTTQFEYCSLSVGPRGRAEMQENKQDLIMQSKVGKVAFGDQIKVNSTTCAVEFDYSLTTKVCRLELSVQSRLSFIIKERVDWIALAKESLKPKKPDDADIFKADECALCLEAAPDLLLFPCHHQCMHARCESDKIATCPFCRAVISAKLLVSNENKQKKSDESFRFGSGSNYPSRGCTFIGCRGCVECLRV